MRASSFWAPVGVTFRELIAHAGGPIDAEFGFFVSGIMMGKLSFDLDDVVTKTTCGLIVLPRDHYLISRKDRTQQSMNRIGKSACDQCSYCTEFCPRYLLGYNVLATNDAVEKLGGNPFGNHTRWYSGSKNDLRLNLQVQRFKMAPAARRALKAYETTGALRIPMVSLHTVADDVVPAWQEILYLVKVDPATSRGKFLPFPVFRYGHCNFTACT